MKKIIVTAVPFALAILLAGCNSDNSSSESDTQSSSQAATIATDPVEDANRTVQNRKLDPLILVNKDNPIPDYWENDVPLVMSRNSLDESIAVEKNTYKAYVDLKNALELESVYIDVASAYRSFNEQNNMILSLTQQYGEEYAKQNTDTPGYSENQTGLALDLYLSISGNTVTDSQALANEADTWAKVHKKLPEYGFILRYPEGKEDVTGHSYQPWHIRYVGSPEAAQEITEKGIALEEYDGAVKTN